MSGIDLKKDKLPVRMMNAESAVKMLCESRATQIYGKNLPELVSKRLSEELDSIINNGYATHFFIAWEVVKASEELGYPVRAGRWLGSSFVAFLLGVSDFNPLEHHYYCPYCNYFEKMDLPGHYGAVAFDLEDKKCPSCGKKLMKDGSNIPYEILVGGRKYREPDIAICVAPIAQKTIFERLSNIFGKEHVLRASIIEKFEKGETKVKVHPSGIHFFPANITADQVTPIIHVKDDAGNDAYISAQHDRFELDYTFITIDIIPDPTLETLRELEKRTGHSQKSISMTDQKTGQIFVNGKTNGIPVFDGQIAKKYLSLMRNGLRGWISFSGLMKVLALSNDVGRWQDGEQRKIKIKNGELDAVICYRDEVFLTLLQHGLDIDEVDYITKRVRMGRLSSPSSIIRGKPAEEFLIDIGIDAGLVKSWVAVEYIQSKASVLSEMESLWRLAYYKAHFHKDFQTVIQRNQNQISHYSEGER